MRQANTFYGRTEAAEATREKRAGRILLISSSLEPGLWRVEEGVRQMNSALQGVSTKPFVNTGSVSPYRLVLPSVGHPSPSCILASEFMQMRNWLLVGVSILDQLKDELHLVLVVLHGDFLVDSMDAEGRSILWGRR